MFQLCQQLRTNDVSLDAALQEHDTFTVHLTRPIILHNWRYNFNMRFDNKRFSCATNSLTTQKVKWQMQQEAFIMLANNK
jgi:hypothetical protein